MSRRSAKITAAAFTALATLALAGCATITPFETPAAVTTPTASPTATPSPTPTESAQTPPAAEKPAPTVTCADAPQLTPADYVEGSFDGLVPMLLLDSGPRQGATGEAITDDDGAPVAYVVAQGDTTAAIAQRFCMDDGSVRYLEALNSVRRNSMFSSGGTPAVVYAGDTLNLSPWTIASVGDENGIVYDYEPPFVIPPQH